VAGCLTQYGAEANLDAGPCGQSVSVGADAVKLPTDFLVAIASTRSHRIAALPETMPGIN
jgi:hypothetical protein